MKSKFKLFGKTKLLGVGIPTKSLRVMKTKDTSLYIRKRSKGVSIGVFKKLWKSK